MKLDGFDPSIHVKVSDVQHNIRDRNDLEETVIFLPWTKVTKEKGKNIFWAKQTRVVNPQSALTNHIQVNNPPAEGYLFTFKYQDNMRPMTSSIFLTRINNIITENNLLKLPRHGI